MRTILKLTLVLLLTTTACVTCSVGQNESKENQTGAVNKNGRFTNFKYDKSKDLTTVRVKRFTISRIGQEKQIASNIPLHQMDLEISYSFAGQQRTKPVDEVVLQFHAVAGNYIFLHGQQIITALDRDIKGKDRAIVLGMTGYKSEAPKFNSVYEEFMTIKIPAEAIRKMAKATTIDLFVGPVEYRLTPQQQDAIREITDSL